MQGLRRFHHLSSGGVRLHLSPAIDVVAESADTRIQRLVSENPVVIFSRASCCMCHVMRILLSSIGVHPTVIELDDDDEIVNTLAAAEEGGGALPAVFIGGTRVGGLEGLVALHLSAQLVPMLVELDFSSVDLEYSQVANM